MKQTLPHFDFPKSKPKPKKKENEKECPYHSDKECPPKCDGKWPKCAICGEVFPFWNGDDCDNEINGFSVQEGNYGCSDSDNESIVEYICVKCYHRIFTDKELELVETGIVIVKEFCECCARESRNAKETCLNRPAKYDKNKKTLYYESGGNCHDVDSNNLIPIKMKKIDFLMEIAKEIWCFEHNRKRELVWNKGLYYYQCPEPIHSGSCQGH